MTPKTLRRSRSDLVAVGGYMGFVAATVVFGLAWAVATLTGGSPGLIGVVAVACALATLVACMVAAARSRVEVADDALKIVNPLGTRVVNRTDIRAVAMRRTTGQVASAQLQLADGRHATVTAVGPRELGEFREALAVDS